MGVRQRGPRTAVACALCREGNKKCGGNGRDPCHPCTRKGVTCAYSAIADDPKAYARSIHLKQKRSAAKARHAGTRADSDHGQWPATGSVAGGPLSMTAPQSHSCGLTTWEQPLRDWQSPAHDGHMVTVPGSIEDQPLIHGHFPAPQSSSQAAQIHHWPHHGHSAPHAPTTQQSGGSFFNHGIPVGFNHDMPQGSSPPPVHVQDELHQSLQPPPTVNPFSYLSSTTEYPFDPFWDYGYGDRSSTIMDRSGSGVTSESSSEAVPFYRSSTIMDRTGSGVASEPSSEAMPSFQDEEDLILASLFNGDMNTNRSGFGFF